MRHQQAKLLPLLSQQQMMAQAGWQCRQGSQLLRPGCSREEALRVQVASCCNPRRVTPATIRQPQNNVHMMQLQTRERLSSRGAVRAWAILLVRPPFQQNIFAPSLFGHVHLDYLLPDWCAVTAASARGPQGRLAFGLSHLSLQPHHQRLAHVCA